MPKNFASMVSPCECVFLKEIRRTKFDAKIWMSLIEVSPPNDSPHQFWAGDLWTETISYFGLKEIYHQAPLLLHMYVKNIITKNLMLLLFFDCLF